MAKLRAAKYYRRLKRPYTRTSRRKSKSYIKGAPTIKVIQYDMGDKNVNFPYTLTLSATKDMNVRDNAIEAARQALGRYMSVALGRVTGYGIKIRVVPHHILRENPLATGAGADRFQTGMTLSYGRPYGHAARVFAGKPLIEVYVNKEDIEVAKEALRKANRKLPMHCQVSLSETK